MDNAALRVAVLSDLHYGNPSDLLERRSDISDRLLATAIEYLNSSFRPAVTWVLGDLINVGDAPNARLQLEYLHSILSRLRSPWYALPGNHDGDRVVFSRVFPQPPDWLDIDGVRWLPFVDTEAPGYWATRKASDLARYKLARRSYQGPLASLQHVCLYPPGSAEIPYNFTNASEIIAAMNRYGVALSISGHYHAGAAPIMKGGTLFVTAPALCEAPFRFLTLNIDGAHISVTSYQLA